MGPYPGTGGDGWVIETFVECASVEGTFNWNQEHRVVWSWWDEDIAAECDQGSNPPACPGDELYVLDSPPNPEPTECGGTNPCDLATGNKLETETDYSGAGAGVPDLARYYNSNGPYKSAGDLGVGWRHTYSRVLDERPDKDLLSHIASPWRSSYYSSDQDACESGWGDIKDSVFGGDLSTATASYATGNVCEINVGGNTVAQIPVVAVTSRPTFPAMPTIRTITRPNGGVYRFEQSGADWVSEFAPQLKLEPSGSNWIFTDSNDTRETYDSTGQLTSIEYRGGQTETLEYDLTSAQGGDDDSSTLDRVTGEFGHEITFAYDSNARLISITTPDGIITYGYDSDNNLSSTTYPDATSRQYVYEHQTLPNHLTGILDENGDRFATWNYDYEGRAILSEHAGGSEQVQIAYNGDGTTTTTTANGAVRTYTFATEQGQRKPAGVVGDVCSNCPGGNIKDRTYDANGFLDEATDWNGNITKTARNSRGLTETLTEAKNSSEQRVTTTVWHATYRLPTSVTTPKNVTDYVYDTDGNPTSVTVSGGGLFRAWTITYNSNGQPLTIDGPRTDVSDITTLDYYDCTSGDECGQLESVTNALNQVTTYDSYDTSGRVTQITDPNGLQSAFSYDSRGNVSSVTETPTVGSARTTTLTYDDVGQLETLTTPLGTVLTYAYDAAHYLISVTDNLGNKIEYSYDSMGNLTDEDKYDPTNTLKRSLDYAYDLNDRLDSVTSGSIATDFTMDSVGNLTTEVDGNQATTLHVYDALNRLDQTTDALSGIIDYGFDAHDNVTSVTAANGAATTYEYNELDDLTKEISTDRGTTTYTYDDAGNLKTRIDARGVTATYAYDALNRLISVSYPNTSENVTYTYDHAASEGVGRLRSISDESGTTTYSYDEFGYVLSDTRQIGSTTYITSYTYDDDGNVASITYPSGRVVDYTRNVLGQVDQITSSKNSVLKTVVSSASYEPFGPVASLTYGNGLVLDYDRNLDFLVNSLTASGVLEKTYTYDPAGNIIELDDTIDASYTRTFDYDALNRLDGESLAGSNGTYANKILPDNPLMYWRLGDTSGTTAVDMSGNGHDGTYAGIVDQGQTSLIGDSDASVGFTLNSGSIAGPAMTGASVTGIETWIKSDVMNANRFFLSLHDGGGSVRTHVYHRSNGYIIVWHDSVSVMYSDSIVSSGEPHHVALWYEPGTNKSYLMIDGVTQNDTYAGNLFAVNDPEVWIGGQRYMGVDYLLYGGDMDEVAVHNQPVTSSTFTNHFALGSGPEFSVDYSYDANGNRTSIDDGSTVTTYAYQTQSNELASIGGSNLIHDLAGNRTADAGGIRTYSYNDSNRLVEVFDNSVSTATYQHNALGQRVKKTTGGNTTLFVYDLDGNLLAEHDATGGLIRDYVWMNGAPVAQIDQGEVFSYLHFDHLNSPRKATNDAQTVVWQWNSDAFGNGFADGDPDGDSTSTTVNLRYPGQYYDQESGLHYNYYRTYNPSTGRYLESDPIGLAAGPNTYGYVGANPLSFIDKFGLDVINNSKLPVLIVGEGVEDDPNSFDGKLCLAPGETFIGRQDIVGVVAENPKADVFKTVDYIDATINEDGTISTSKNESAPWYVPSRTGQLIRGGLLSKEEIEKWTAAKDLQSALKEMIEDGSCECKK